MNNKIKEFKNKEYKSEPVSKVVEDLYEFYNCYNMMTANIGAVVFRVRKITNEQKHDTCQALWCPPAKYVKQVGRANDIGESIFYAALDPLTAILETRISINDNFSIGTYYLSPLDSWNMTSVVINVPKRGANQSKQLDDYSIDLSKFMVEEFTKQVSEDRRFDYKKSCAMAKILLDLPNKDSIIYPSMKNMSKVNIAMIEEIAKKRLQLQSVLKCKLIGFTDDNKAKVEISSLAQSKQGNDSLDYEPIPNKVETISHNTWVKQPLSFDDDFNSNRISSPEKIISDMLGK